MHDDAIPRIGLPEEILSDLKTSQRILADAAEEMDRAERCGLSCKDIRKHAAKQRERIDQMLREYDGLGKPLEG